MSASATREPMAKLSLPELAAMKGQRRIAMVTAYDAPSARLAEQAGVDVVLVGDSAATVVLGLDSTTRATLDQMTQLTAAVARGAKGTLVVADMPFGSYQVSDEDAVWAGVRLIKSGADAVKLEGAGPQSLRVKALVGAGVAVMGHVGLTPQSATLLGGYRAQGRTATSARQLLQSARELEAAGVFALVIEAVPPQVADQVTAAVSVPTIGIGAGAGCDGQVLVWHDLLGLSEGHQPRFVKRYAELGEETRRALAAYVDEVRSGAFPGAEHVYSMPKEELQELGLEEPTPATEPAQ